MILREGPSRAPPCLSDIQGGHKVPVSFQRRLQRKGRSFHIEQGSRENGRALECMPYTLVTEMERLAMDLEIASWHDEDRYLPNAEDLLPRVQSWLAKVPKDAA